MNSTTKRSQHVFHIFSVFHAILMLQIISPRLCKIIKGDEFFSYLDNDKGYLNIILCFLDPPKFMLKQEETPNDLTDRQVLELGVDGVAHQDLQDQEMHVDPLYQLFIPEQHKELSMYTHYVPNYW